MKFLIALIFVEALVLQSVRSLPDQNADLFKYNPSDVYTLPADIDEDKPAVQFTGDVMKARIERLQNINGNKKFKLDLKTQNGIEVSSVGKLKDEKTFVVSGSYSFTGADGKRYTTRYTADEFGYHPMTELELTIPEPQPLEAAASSLNTQIENNSGGLYENGRETFKNKFQFLNQNLNPESSYTSSLSGSGLSGDDYSYYNPAGPQYGSDSFDGSTDYKSGSGYNYNAPSIGFSAPVGEYLPPQ